MPSATTSMPSARARVRIAVTIEVLLSVPLPPSPTTNERSIFSIRSGNECR